MGDLFKNILSSDQTLFKNELALSYDYIPKLIPYRETQQKYAASCIKPLFAGRNGKNLFIFGLPGIGKTVACKHLFSELEEETDDVKPIYINCWQKNTTHKIILEICDILDYKMTHNKKTEELVQVIKVILNKKSAVFCFDEVDKVEDFDFLYTLLEEIYRKSVFLITNFRSWLEELDERIKSRLTAEVIEFKPYNYNETKGILNERLDYGFYPNVWDNASFEVIVDKTTKLQDIRLGLYLMRETGMIAEAESSKKVTIEHVKKAIVKIDDFCTKNSDDLTNDERLVLELVRENPNKKIGDLYEQYKLKEGNATYKTFQRRIEKLQSNRFIAVEKTNGGKEGNTTILRPLQTKKLTEF